MQNRKPGFAKPLALVILFGFTLVAGPEVVSLYGQEARVPPKGWRVQPVPFPVHSLAISPREAGGLNPARSLVAAGGSSLVEISLEQWASNARFDFASAKISDSSLKIGALSVNRNSFISGSRQIEYGFVRKVEIAKHDIGWTRESLSTPVSALAASKGAVFVALEDGSIASFDAADGRPLWKQPVHAKLITSMAVLGDQWLASGDWTGKLIVSDQKTGAEVANFSQHRDAITGLIAAQGAENAPNSRRGLYSCSVDGTVRLWFPGQRRLVRFVSLDSPVRAITIVEEGKLLAATSDGTIHLVDMQDAEIVERIQSPLAFVSSMVTDGSNLFVCDGKRRIGWRSVHGIVKSNE